MNASVTARAAAGFAHERPRLGVRELVARALDFLTLEPGVIILTGTPGGVGIFRKPPVSLKPGDEVEVEIEGIGILRNPVHPEKLMRQSQATFER